MHTKSETDTTDFFALLPKEIVQHVLLNLFPALKTEELLGHENKSVLISRFLNLAHVIIANKKMFSAYNDNHFLQELVFELTRHYGFIFEKGKENNILYPFNHDLNKIKTLDKNQIAKFDQDNISFLKKLLRVLITFDIRNFLSYDEKTLKEIQNSLNEILNQEPLSNNPICIFIKTLLCLRLGNPAKTTLQYLNQTAELGLLNAQYAKDYFGFYLNLPAFNNLHPVTKTVTPIHFPNSTSIKIASQSLNAVAYHKQLLDIFSKLNINLPSFDELKNIKQKNGNDSYLLHSYYFSWLLALAVDYHRTQKILNLLDRKVIPLNKNQILSLAQSSAPHVLIQTIAAKDPKLLSEVSSRLVTLYANELGPSLYKKSLTGKHKTMASVQSKDKKKRRHYIPANVVTTFKKMPQLLNRLSITNAIDSINTINLLSHTSVDLKKWKMEELYDFLFNRDKAISKESSEQLQKLPHLLTLYNKADDILAFLKTEESKLLETSNNGNLLLIKLSRKVTEALTLQVHIPRNENTYNASLLKFLAEMPYPLSQWLIEKNKCNLSKISSVIHNNTAFKKIITSSNLNLLSKYFSDMDKLLSLDEKKIQGNITVLDFLVNNPQLEKITLLLPNVLALVTASDNRLLECIHKNSAILNLTPHALKKFHAITVKYSRSPKTILDIFVKAPPAIYHWIGQASEEYIIQLAHKEVLEVLASCPHLPDYQSKDLKKILIFFELLHVNMFDEKTSFLQFLLSPALRSVLIPILNFIELGLSNTHEVLLKANFLKTIAKSNTNHPLFREHPVQDWYSLYSKQIVYTTEHMNLLGYITAPCNTIYWNLIKQYFNTIDVMCLHAQDIINFIEQHPSKISFFAKSRMNAKQEEGSVASQLSNRNKRLREEAKQEVKRQKLSDETPAVQSSPNNESYESTENPYSRLLTAFNNLNNSQFQQHLSPKEEIERLELINIYLRSMITQLEHDEKSDKVFGANVSSLEYPGFESDQKLATPMSYGEEQSLEEAPFYDEELITEQTQTSDQNQSFTSMLSSDLSVSSDEDQSEEELESMEDEESRYSWNYS